MLKKIQTLTRRITPVLEVTKLLLEIAIALLALKYGLPMM
jgi:hypothetical protein